MGVELSLDWALLVYRPKPPLRWTVLSFVSKFILKSLPFRRFLGEAREAMWAGIFGVSSISQALVLLNV